MKTVLYKRFLSLLLLAFLIVFFPMMRIEAKAAPYVPEYDDPTYALSNPNNVTGQDIVDEARSWVSKGINNAFYPTRTGFDDGGPGYGVARRTGYNSYIGESGLSFDCSGFVSRVLNDVGLRGNVGNGADCVYKQKYGNYISSDMCYMFRYGECLNSILGHVNAGDYSGLQPGDILGWCCLHDGGGDPWNNHIVIYAGNGKMIEFTGSGYKDRDISGSGYVFARGARLVSTGSTYLSQCTYSSSSDTVEVTSANAWFKALPCSNETAKKYDYTSVSVIESALPVGTTLRTSGLYKNTEGNYWYAATILNGAYAGKSGYIYRGDTKVVYAPQSNLEPETTGGAGTIFVKGWSFDRDALNSPVPIHVYVGGPADSGAKCYIVDANKYRHDVNEVFPGVGDYHGFKETLTVEERGTQTLYFYAVDLNGGPGNQFIDTATVTISEPSTSNNSIQLDVPLLPQSTGYTCADASARECIAYYYDHGIVTGKSATVPSESQLVSEYGSGSTTPIVNGLRDYCGVSFGYREKTTPEDFYSYISNSLRKGNPVVANVYLNADTSWVLGYTTKNGHYIVISGLKEIGGETYLTITDPWNINGAGIGQVIDVPWIHICNICVYYVCEQNGLEVVQLPTGSLMTVGAGRTIPDGDYIIATAADSNYFLDIVGEDLPAVNGANVSLYGPRNGEVPAYDVWTVKYIEEGGFYSICQKGTNMSLDVDGASITAGGNIQVYTHHGDSCQQWSIFKNEDGSYRIRAKCSGFSLDYYDGVLAAGTNVVQWFDTDYGNQKWTFIPCACTVTYDANGGTNAPDSQTAEIGSTITLSNDIPSRASTTESYTVTLNANGGSVSQSSLSVPHTTSYSFKNWNTKASGIGTSYNPGASYPANESATLYAQWNYTIKYNSTVLPIPTREGYAFKGWGTSSSATDGVSGDYTPNGNVTLYAIWEEVKYTVSYDANGGIGAPEAQMVRAGTAAILSTVEPTREGYVFLGWTTSSTATSPEYLAGSSFTPERDTTLFAVWEKGTLSEWSEIKPTGVDESLIETKIQYRYRDKETTTSTESSMDGWIFEGSQQVWGEYGPWSEWQDNAIAQNESTKVETRTVYPYYYFYCTYCGTGARYPYWGSSLRCEICGNTETRPVGASAVEWFPNPWSDSVRWGNDSEKYYQYINGEIWWNWTDGSPKTQYKASTRGTESIYHFYRWTGWSAWGDSEITENDTREVDTRTLYRYVVTPYTITYDANGGTGAPAAQTKTQGTNLTLTTATPTRANSSAVSYTVTLDANGGSVSTTSLSAARTTSYTFKNWNTAANGSGTSYNAGATYSTDADVTLYAQWNSSTSTAVVTLPTPTRSGYSFLGWGTTSSASSGVTGSYTPTGNVTLYAIWDANAYPVSYDANGGTNAPNSQAKIHDTALTLTTSTPTRADASAGIYTVTLNANGGSVSTTSLDVARTISYSFKNWNTAANGSGTSYAPGASYTVNAALTLYAQWNSSTSTAAVTLPTPTREGYSFLGWGISSSATSGTTGSYTPTGNVTLYAVWDTNAYPVSYDANGGTNAPNSQAKIHDTALTLTTSTPTHANASAGSYTVTLNANGGNVSTAFLSAARTTSYSFKNWNTAANGSGTSYAPGASYTANAALTLYAQWNSSTSTAAVTLPTPTRSGYSFLGWGTSSSAASGLTGSYTPTGDVTLYAIWDANSYPVSYDANGGTNAPNSQAKIHDTALILTTSTPTRTNASAGSYIVTLNANGGSVSTESLSAARTTSYSFKNWNTAANGSGTSYAPGASYTANAALTLYAQWNSSTSTPAVTLPTPIREGYSFLGWGISSSATSGTTGSYTPTGDVTLYAVWDVNSYPVSYEANGGTNAPNSQAKIHDTALTLTTSTPTRADASAGSYTVTFNANGGSVSTSSLTAVRTTSYSFKNWNTAANGSGTSYAPGASYTANAALTLYAQWNSSTSTASVTLPMPTREGYSFKGWGTSENATEVVTGAYTPTENVKLFAIWEPKKYTIIFVNDDDTVLQTGEVAYGMLPTYTGQIPTKVATAQYTYTFRGWAPEVVAVTGEATYKATYTETVNSYTVTWLNDDGSEIDTSTIEYDAVPTHADATKGATEEYTYAFLGWQDTATNAIYSGALPKVSGPVTYKAYFISSVNKYIIMFVNEDGTELQGSSVTYGRIPKYDGETPTKEATAVYTYTFAGWTPEVVVVTGEATYKATFTATKRSYTITWKNDDETVIDTTTVEYGKTPTHANPTKAATSEYTYNFAGWTPEVIAVTGDATYKATFTATPVFSTPIFNLPTAIKTIEESAFEGLPMTIVEIPNGCESISKWAFKDCTSLTQIRIPASVTFIDDMAFDGCANVFIFGATNSTAKTFCDSHANCTFVAEDTSA